MIGNAMRLAIALARDYLSWLMGKRRSLIQIRPLEPRRCLRHRLYWVTRQPWHGAVWYRCDTKT